MLEFDGKTTAMRAVFGLMDQFAAAGATIGVMVAAPFFAITHRIAKARELAHR